AEPHLAALGPMFGSVALFPADGLLALVVGLGLAARLRRAPASALAPDLLAVALMVLAVAAALSARVALAPSLAAGLAGQLVLRAFGTFPHPNILGGYLALALVCLPMLWNAWRGGRWPLWGAAALLAGGLLATFSRAGWLAALVGLGAWWVASGKWRSRRGRA